MRFLAAGFVFFIMVIIIGCSGGSGINMPSENTGLSIDTPLPIGISEYIEDGSPSGGMGALGVFQLNVDPAEPRADLTSLRQGMLTDVLEVVDITNFLSLAPCTDCAKISSVSLDADGNVVISIGIKHPFGVGDPLKPISGQNRADLHVFNVEGMVVSDAPAKNFPGLNESIAGFDLVSADGYSGYLDTALDDVYLTDATIHPYMTHFDDYSSGNFDAANPMGFENVIDPGPSGNLVMAMGCDYDYQDYIFNLDNAPIVFIFVVGCTYAVSSASKNDRFTPEYRCPQHNKKAASEISFEVITNNLAGEDTASTADVEVRVVDVSHGVAVGEALNEMFADSSVDDIMIDVPDIMTMPFIIDGNNPVSGGGHDPSDPLVYEGTITNTAGVTEGTYTGVVKVSDSYLPGQNTALLLDAKDGIKSVDPTQNPLEGLFDIPEFATYQTFEIYVMLGNDPPVAVLNTDPDPPVILQYLTIDLDATESYDPDGTVDLYEYDFDWDGVEINFVADDSNTTGLITTSSYDTDGFYTIGLRVTDNESAVDYDSVDLEVQTGCVIFVDDDNTTGPWDGSPSNPYQYVQDGVDAAIDDCIVWIKPGTYYEDEGGPTTSDDAEVTIDNIQNLTLHGEDMPVIEGHRYYAPPYPWPSGIRATNCNGLIIKGIELSLYYHNTAYIRLSDCNNAVVQDCDAHRSPLDSSGGAHAFINAVNCDSLIVKNNTYLDSTNSSSNSNHLGYLNNCDNAILTLNKLINNANGSNVYHTFWQQLQVYYSSNVEISKNVFGQHNKVDFYDLRKEYDEMKIIRIYGGSNNVIRNNLIYDLSFYSQNFSAEARNWAIEISNSPNIKIYNNTIDNFGPDQSTGPGYTYGIRLDSASSIGAELYNNIITNLSSNGNSTTYGLYSAGSVTQTYSDVWNLTGGTTARYAGSASEGTGGIEANPLFTDPSTYDYTLQSGSPCKGTGLNGYDMGCYGGSDPLP